MAKAKPYSQLARFYDHLMHDIDYPGWAEYASDMLSPFIKKKARILELAAGNGIFASYLKYYYPNIIISDLSFEMVDSVHATKLPRLVCSFDAIPFKPEFDAVVCLFDSINYALSAKQIKKVFHEVYSVLKPGGMFLFDCCLHEGSKEHVELIKEEKHSSNEFYSHESIYDERSGIHKNIFKIRVPETSVEIIEEHTQRIYPIETFFQLLEKEKFQILECFKNFTFEDYDSDAKRAQFLARKK
jgi:ubiquinone/menaquinone biosynthesis C-methylase UbiE